MPTEYTCFGITEHSFIRDTLKHVSTRFSAAVWKELCDKKFCNMYPFVKFIFLIWHHEIGIRYIGFLMQIMIKSLGIISRSYEYNFYKVVKSILTMSVRRDGTAVTYNEYNEYQINEESQYNPHLKLKIHAAYV